MHSQLSHRLEENGFFSLLIKLCVYLERAHGLFIPLAVTFPSTP